MDSLIILLMAFLLFLVLVGILVYITLKRRYNEKHLVEDYTLDDNSFDEQEVEVIRIKINDEIISFDANGYVFNNDDSVKVLYNGSYVLGTVVSGNNLETIDSDKPLKKLEIESSIDKDVEKFEINPSIDNDIEVLEIEPSVDKGDNEKIKNIVPTKKYADEDDFTFPDFESIKNSLKNKD